MTSPRPVSYYRERSRHFANMVAGEIARGEMELACEVLWGAAAHAIKSVAQRKGWTHDSHSLRRAAVIRLITEERAPPHLRGQYYIASGFHVGFYEGSFNAEHIIQGRALIAEFVQTLESLPDRTNAGYSAAGA